MLEELEHNAKASGNRPLERRLADLTVWLYHNKQRIPPSNVEARLALTEKALWIALEVMAFQVERLHELEAEKASNLWLPKGVVANGDMRKFG